MAMGHLCDLKAYLQKNERGVINYREWRDAGRRISTSAVEGTVNRLIGRRMCKAQHMCWSKRGAHLLLQVRCATLNGDLLASGIPALVSVCRYTTSHNALGLVTPSFVTVPNDTGLRKIHTGAS